MGDILENIKNAVNGKPYIGSDEYVKVSDIDLSGYSDKLWQSAYEYGMKMAKLDQEGNRNSVWYGLQWTGYHCGRCGAEIPLEKYKYCPMCGLKFTDTVRIKYDCQGFSTEDLT